MSDLDKFLDSGYKSGFGMTREEAWDKGICVQCKKEATWYSEAGKREYQISAVCEPCFDALTGED